MRVGCYGLIYGIDRISIFYRVSGASPLYAFYSQQFNQFLEVLHVGRITSDSW